jgi:hypothetical protein
MGLNPDDISAPLPHLSHQPHYGSEVHSTSNRNEYHESYLGEGAEQSVGKADNITAICETTV